MVDFWEQFEEVKDMPVNNKQDDFFAQFEEVKPETVPQNQQQNNILPSVQVPMPEPETAPTAQLSGTARYDTEYQPAENKEITQPDGLFYRGYNNAAALLNGIGRAVIPGGEGFKEGFENQKEAMRIANENSDLFRRFNKTLDFAGDALSFGKFGKLGAVGKLGAKFTPGMGKKK